jgi:hypothetical protein
MSEVQLMKVPSVIPPRSIIRLARADSSAPAWIAQIGREFRVGYYSPQDGLDCIWLVNSNGEYEQTTDKSALLKYFDIVRLSKEPDLFGNSKAPLRRVKTGHVRENRVVTERERAR